MSILLADFKGKCSSLWSMPFKVARSHLDAHHYTSNHQRLVLDIFPLCLTRPACLENGPQFISEEFDWFLKQNGIKHILIAPYHPSSNRAVATS